MDASDLEPTFAAAIEPHTPDALLLRHFAAHRDEAAFAELVQRHGPMVLAVCRRVLGEASAAEDAFQATFMVLARKAETLKRPESLAAWLHGVARRAALKARSATRNPATFITEQNNPADPHGDPLAEVTGRELLAIVEEEIDRLPGPYRLAMVLCCLEGLTIEQAARQLSVTPGAVRGRLERARSWLHARLATRGLAPALVLALVATAQSASASTMGLQLLTVQAACRFAADVGAAGAAVPAVPRLIAEGVLHAMWISKLKLIVGAALIALAGVAPLAAGGPGGAKRVATVTITVAVDTPQEEGAEETAAPSKDAPIRLFLGERSETAPDQAKSLGEGAVEEREVDPKLRTRCDEEQAKQANSQAQLEWGSLLLDASATYSGTLTGAQPTTEGAFIDVHIDELSPTSVGPYELVFKSNSLPYPLVGVRPRQRESEVRDWVEYKAQYDANPSSAGSLPESVFLADGEGNVHRYTRSDAKVQLGFFVGQSLTSDGAATISDDKSTGDKTTVERSSPDAKKNGQRKKAAQ